MVEKFIQNKNKKEFGKLPYRKKVISYKSKLKNDVSKKID